MNCVICNRSEENMLKLKVDTIVQSTRSYGIRDVLFCQICSHFMDFTTFKTEEIYQGQDGECTKNEEDGNISYTLNNETAIKYEIEQKLYFFSELFKTVQNHCSMGY